jgi:hypothetical protein
MRLLKVSNQYWLHIPNGIGGRERIWLRPGQILDADDSFVARSIRGQEYKLEPAPANSKPTEIDQWPMAMVRAYEQAKPAPAAPAREKISSVTQAPIPVVEMKRKPVQ